MKILLFCLQLSLIALVNSLYAQSGNITIKSNPSGAKIYINGEDSRATTPYQKTMFPGVYNLILYLNNHREYSGQFTISPNRNEELNIDLKPSFGSLHITSNPDGADCILDGQRKGITPLVLNNVGTGNHKLEINKSGYNNLVEDIKIEDEKTFEKTYNLSSSFGTIGIMAKPDADIFIDGKLVGNKKYSGQLNEGLHTIEVRKDHYISDIRTITIEKEQQYPISITLKPKLGILSIKCDPADAIVTLDNETVGKTPVTLNNILEGEHILKIEKDEYRPYEKRIKITQDQTLVIDTVLILGAAIHITSTPDGSLLKIDGESKGNTPIDLIVKKGQRDIEITKSGYEIFKTSIDISQDKDYTFELKRLVLNLQVSSSPSGASLNINNQDMGKTPLKASLDYGSNDFSLFLNGFKPITKKIEVTEPSQIIKFQFEPLKPRTKGKAIIYSLLFPGAGQSYLARTASPVLLGLAAYGCLAGGYIMNTKSVGSYNDYLAETNDLIKRKSLADDWTKQKQLSEILVVSAATIWAANLIWVVLMPDDTKRFNNINIQSFFDPNNKSSGLKLALNF